MYSIYHFFAHLYRNRGELISVEKLENFQFDSELLSCTNSNSFPDMAIRINPLGDPLGGELIELKDSRTSYTVASFNSTIPTGKKLIEAITRGKTGKPNVVYKRMRAAGEDPDSLQERDVFYLVRGKKGKQCKVCLVHGSFFETVKVEDLIKRALSKVLEERLVESEIELDDDLSRLLDNISLPQDSFNQVRHIECASVKLRFRIMTEADSAGNIMDSEYYPKITDDTLSLVVPCHSDDDKVERLKHLRQALSSSELEHGDAFTIKHPFNGCYFVQSFPINISQKGPP